MKIHILRWTLIGLFIRFLIMPFSFHGDDIFFIYYAPFKFIEQGIWNPYPYPFFTVNNVYNPYFPPITLFTISAFLFFLKPLLPNLHNLFSFYESQVLTWGGNTIHYANTLMDYQLFRTLFVFKVPYLILDFGTAWLLFQILRSDKKKSLWAYKIWMLNPFVLHSCYALGQIDIIPTFFTMATIYCFYLNRRYLAMISLSLGAMAKIFPLIFLPFAILLAGDTLKDRFKLFIAAIVPLFIITMPFYLSSPDAISKAMFFSSSNIPFFKQIFFMGSYSTVLCLFFFIKKEGRINLGSIILSFVLASLLFYSFYNVTIRYFILITPLLIYVALKEKRFWFYNIIFLITLFELRNCANSQQWGLFAALHPEFFSSLPILDSYFNLAVNVKYIHQIMYRLFFISSLMMAVHILIVNRNFFRFPFLVGGRDEKN